MSGKNSGKTKGYLRQAVGLLAVVLLAAYFVYMFISYTGKTSVSFYEVEEGSLVREHTYTGLILRSEKTLSSGSSGYVTYYISEGKKAAMNARIYSIDQSGDLKAALAAHAEELNSLSGEKLDGVRTSVIYASREFDPMDFSSSAKLREDLETAVLEVTDTDALTAFADELKASGISFTEYRTDTTGIVSYLLDEYSDLKRVDITADKFDRSAYRSSRHSSGELLAEGDPVCRLITDEAWEIVFPMEEADLTEFAEKQRLRIRFTDRDIDTYADFLVFRGTDGKAYGCLSFSRYLIQFISERFVEFEIVTNDVSGLKIPEKSILRKNFYVIPSEYKDEDENGNTGFYKEELSESGTELTFVVTEIYYDDGAECYVDLKEGSGLQAGDQLAAVKTTGSRYRIGAVKPLEGVYNINKGYTVFKRIEEEPDSRANGYCIVKKNTSYGLSVYDHIILDASTVEEGQVLY